MVNTVTDTDRGPAQPANPTPISLIPTLGKWELRNELGFYFRPHAQSVTSPCRRLHPVLLVGSSRGQDLPGLSQGLSSLTRGEEGERAVLGVLSRQKIASGPDLLFSLLPSHFLPTRFSAFAVFPFFSFPFYLPYFLSLFREACASILFHSRKCV